MYKNLLSKNLVFKGLAWGSGSVGLSMSLGFAGKIQGPERLESGFRAHYYDKIKKWNKVSMYIKTTRRLNDSEVIQYEEPQGIMLVLIQACIFGCCRVLMASASHRMRQYDCPGIRNTDFQGRGRRA